MADLRASTPSNAAEIAVPDCREIADLLTGFELRASQGMRKQISLLRDRLESCCERRVLTEPTAAIDNRRMELDRCRERLCTARTQQLGRYRQSFVGLAASLEAMSPLRVLTRGYSIASDKDGNCLHSAAQFHIGDEIRLRLSDGSADCRVENVKRS